jgi:hypothetical protein
MLCFLIKQSVLPFFFVDKTIMAYTHKRRLYIITTSVQTNKQASTIKKITC